MELIEVTLFKDGKKYLIQPCCEDCHANIQVKPVESFSGRVHIAYCPKCGNYLKVINYQQNGLPSCAICFFHDGNKICCTFGDFENLQESPAGFGDTHEEAFADLQQEWEKYKKGLTNEQ